MFKTNQWAYQWIQMPQAQEIAFSRKKNITTHGTIFFNNLPIVKEYIQKRLGMFLDNKLRNLVHIN